MTFVLSDGKWAYKKIMQPVMVGMHLLVVNVYVLEDKTALRIGNSNFFEGESVSQEKPMDWFQQKHIEMIMKDLKAVIISRITNSLLSSKHDGGIRKLMDIEFSYEFHKRSFIPGQSFLLSKSQDYCFCGKKITKKDVQFKSHSTFREILEIRVKKLAGDPNVQHVETKLCGKTTIASRKEDERSDYFNDENHTSSSVKRKKTTLRRIAKKSRLALASSYQTVEQIDLHLVQSKTEEFRKSSLAKNGQPAIVPEVVNVDQKPDGLEDVRKVEDLNNNHLRFLIRQMETYLRTIFRGEVYCRRHEDYKKGGKLRDDLNFQVGMAHFNEEQHECIMNALISMFCYKGPKYLNYVTKVMLPEALIKLYEDIHKTSHDQAEECLFKDTILDN
ncbi:uncharacterized protein LOC124442420 [Xenia sp. Carnegie-2017]|uniref:uncharacterized protein LOC124442420 n=1 Tax=Xenia sp. Carnegie-2017 TaxID=2897299 RepID=UPI001F04A6DF|nr:uncharacterized protein LOC124442420 [Xenia sp. Carnegie-2017]